MRRIFWRSGIERWEVFSYVYLFFFQSAPVLLHWDDFFDCGACGVVRSHDCMLDGTKAFMQKRTIPSINPSINEFLPSAR